jgi:hypothetical protein
MRPVIMTYRTLTFGVLPLRLDFLLGWVAIQNYAFISVRDTVQVKCSFIRQTYEVQENPIFCSISLQIIFSTVAVASFDMLVHPKICKRVHVTCCA